MIHLTYNEIRALCDDRLFRDGFRFYQRQLVSQIVQVDNTIKATVNDTDEQSVSLEFSSKEGQLIDYSCTCKSNYTFEPCEHIIAVLLQILYSKEQLFKSFQSSNNESLLNTFESIITTTHRPEKSKELINLEIIVNPKINDITLLSFRIGTDKLYVLQNISDLLTAIHQQKSYSVNTNFTYSPTQHSFTPVDTSILDVLSHYHLGLIENQQTNPFATSFIKSTINLPDFLLLKVLRYLKEKSFTLRLSKINYDEQSIHHDLSLDFNIDETNANFNIEVNQNYNFSFLTKNKEFLLYNDMIYQLTTKEIMSINAITKYFTNNKLSLNKVYGSRIFSSIIPTLNSIGNVDIKESIKDKIIDHPLEAVINLDKSNNSVKATLSFVYGNIDISIYPAKKSSDAKDLILIRDLQKEEHIINLLKESNYIIADDASYFTYTNSDDLFYFIYDYLPLLANHATIYYSEAFKELHIQNDHQLNTNIRLNNTYNILEFSFEFSGVDKSELEELYQSLKTKKKYYQFKNGSFMQLNTEFTQQFVALMDTLEVNATSFQKGIVEIPKYRAIILDQFLRSDTIINYKKNRDFSRLIKDIKNTDKLNFEIPDLNNAKLRDYQKLGFNWLKTLSNYGFGGILADDMGLGKTIQSISLILSSKSQLPSIVIAPTSLIYNWVDEINRFAPDLKVCMIVGPKRSREQLLNEINDYQIVITSYGLAKRDIEEYLNYQFEYCIIDEAQHIKNPTSLNSKSVKLIQANCRFALTGTPIENSLTELWSIFDFIMPGFLHSHHQFTKKYEKPIIKSNDPNSISQLTTLIEPFILRRLKTDVLSELPPKIETKITTDLLDSQKKLYLAYLNEAKKELKDSSTNGKSNTMKVLSILTRLRQICCHPSMFIDDYTHGSAKLELLEELVLDALESNHRILIFSQFTSMLSIIKELLDKDKVTYFYIDGSTKPKERLNMVNEFNAGKNEIFLISLKAGGTGLNLTGADMVIHFDPWWNPATEEQATDRAYRIGQEKTVQVFRLITTGTIEEKIYTLQQTKKSLIDSVIKPGETFINSFTEDELLNLLNYH